MSKGLEILEKIINDITYEDLNNAYAVDGIIFKNDYDTIEKELKALEIIKAKRVDMWHLMDMLEQDYIMYCAWCVAENYSDEFVLTQQEFDLLKEVLEDE